MLDEVFTALNVLAEGDQNFTAEIEDNKFKGQSSFITVRTSSCGKVMFSQASAILSTGGWRCTPTP